MSGSSLITLTDSAVAILELHRPLAKNALDPALVERLGSEIERVAADPAIRAVVLTGAGGSFCAGADLKEASTADASLAHEASARIDGFHRLIRGITSAPKPFLAAVDGPAVGFGCDLALACDIRWISPRAYFQEKFVALGLMPDGGSTFLLPRLVGLTKATELLLTGDIVNAEDAISLGIANRMVAAGDVVSHTIAFARKLAKGPPLAFARIKAALYQGHDGSLDDALRREKQGQIECLSSDDAREGIAAWIEKREPWFQGT